MALKPCRECQKKVSTEAVTCPSCGVPNPTTNKKTIKKDKDSRIWAHCSNKKCEDYTQMYTFHSSKLKSDTCIICNSLFKQATMEDGRPVMPSKISFNKPAKKNSKPWGTEPLKETTSSSNSIPTTSSNDTSWEKFMEGKLDLKTAFWGYGFFGSIIVGVVCGFLAEAVGNFFILVYIISVVVLVIGLWTCASTYKKQMAQKKESEVWGVLTQVYCVVAALGLANFIKDFL